MKGDKLDDETWRTKMWRMRRLMWRWRMARPPTNVVHPLAALGLLQSLAATRPTRPQAPAHGAGDLQPGGRQPDRLLALAGAGIGLLSGGDVLPEGGRPLCATRAAGQTGGRLGCFSVGGRGLRPGGSGPEAGGVGPGAWGWGVRGLGQHLASRGPRPCASRLAAAI